MSRRVEVSGSQKILVIPAMAGLRTFAITTTSKMLINLAFRWVKIRSTRHRGSNDENQEDDAGFEAQIPTLPSPPFPSALTQADVWDALSLGFFLGGYSVISKFVEQCLVVGAHRTTSTPPLSFIAGSVAGLSLLFSGNRERRHTIATYLFVQACTKLAADLVQRKVLPNVPGIDTVLFVLSSAIIMHAYAAEPDALPPSYNRFLIKMGPVDRHALQMASSIMHNEEYSPDTLQAFCQKMKVSTPDSPPRRLDCFFYHPGRTDCTRVCLTIFVTRFFKSLVYYAPLTVFRLIAALRAKSTEERVRKLKEWIVLLGRLASFLAAFVALYQTTACLEANLLAPNPSHPFVYGGIGGVAGLSLVLAPPTSRPEIVSWMLPRALQTLHNWLKKRHLVPIIADGDTILFSLSAGLLYTYWHHSPQLLSSTVRNVLDVLFQK